MKWEEKNTDKANAEEEESWLTRASKMLRVMKGRLSLQDELKYN